MSPDALNDLLETLFTGRDTPVARDLKLNLKRLLGGEASLAPAESAAAVVAAAAALSSQPLADLGAELAAGAELSDDLVREARESAAIMGMLNVYYRFKHFLESGQGKEHVEAHYKAAGLRMTSLAKPGMGKAAFEQLAFAVSVLNGCESCVNAHEEELRKLGVGTDKLHDLARLAAVAKGASVLLA